MHNILFFAVYIFFNHVHTERQVDYISERERTAVLQKQHNTSLYACAGESYPLCTPWSLKGVLDAHIFSSGSPVPGWSARSTGDSYIRLFCQTYRCMERDMTSLGG